MAKFCTACGTPNDDAAGFCEECGKPLRSVAAAASVAPGQAPPLPEPAASPAGAPAPGRWLLPAVLGAGVLVIAIGGIAWWASPPAASADAFANALRGPSGASATPSADLLCVANLPYDRPQINAQQYDASTRRWMDALVSAGLYTAGQPVAGLFQQLIQYTPTPELGTWRRGARLCAAKSWSVSEVKGGRFSPEKLGQHTLYRASVVWKAEGVAPWLAHVPAQWSPDLRVDGGSLTTESSQVFEVRDRRWVVLTTADFGQIQRELVQAGRRGVNSKATKSDQGGMFSALTNLFSGFGTAHPLVGEWAVDTSTPLGGFLGAALPFKGGRVTFGNDYMESGGERVKARFEVSGDVVSVRAEGESDAIQFKMKGKNEMAMDFGLTEIPFNRVR